MPRGGGSSKNKESAKKPTQKSGRGAAKRPIKGATSKKKKKRT